MSEPSTSFADLAMSPEVGFYSTQLNYNNKLEAGSVPRFEPGTPLADRARNELVHVVGSFAGLALAYHHGAVEDALTNHMLTDTPILGHLRRLAVHRYQGILGLDPTTYDQMQEVAGLHNVVQGNVTYTDGDWETYTASDYMPLTETCVAVATLHAENLVFGELEPDGHEGPESELYATQLALLGTELGAGPRPRRLAHLETEYYTNVLPEIFKSHERSGSEIKERRLAQLQAMLHTPLPLADGQRLVLGDIADLLCAVTGPDVTRDTAKLLGHTYAPERADKAANAIREGVNANRAVSEMYRLAMKHY